MNQGFFIFGHRGTINVEGIGENTVASITRGLQDGADGIEFDTYAVRDRHDQVQVVLMHDDTLDRTTNGQGLVISKTYEELRELDAGQGEPIPTVEEALLAMRGFKQIANQPITSNIELKGPATAAPVATILERCLDDGWQWQDFLVSSFDHRQLKQFHQLMPDIATAVLIDDWQFLRSRRSINSAIKLAHNLGSIAINPGLGFLSPSLIDQIHTADLKAYVWTGATEADIRKVYESGADGIFANDPALARKVSES